MTGWRGVAPLMPYRGYSVRKIHSTALLDGRVLVTAGCSEPQTAILDPVAGTTSEVGPMAIGRYRHGLVTLPDGRVLAAGGDGGSGALESCELFDPANGTWRPAPPLARPRANLACAVSGNRVLAVGGSTKDGKPCALVEAWTPGDAAWEVLPPLPETAYAPTAVVLAEGFVLLVYSILLFLWDPSSEAWSRIPGSRTVDSAIHPFDGGVAFLGGSNDNNATATVRAWSRADGWSELPPLPEPRTKAQAIALADGRVALIGGYRTETRAAAGSGEMDGSEYRPENRWYTAEVMLPTLAIGSPRGGWTSTESPRLGTPRLFRMANGGIACVQDEDAQILASIWEPPS